MFSFEIVASSNTSSSLVYSIQANGTELTVDPTTGNVTWFINSTDFRLRYVVTDSNNNSASLSPTVTLCNCRNGGTCNPATTNTLVESTNNLLIYGECTCLSGFSGAFCQTSVTYCLQEPCFEGVNCTDNITTQSADCDPCPTGYIGDGRKCFGITILLLASKNIFSFYCFTNTFSVIIQWYEIIYTNIYESFMNSYFLILIYHCLLKLSNVKFNILIHCIIKFH